MVVFWLLAALMVLLALAFILVPLLRPRADPGPCAAEANLDVLRSQRREIEADVASGVLPADARDEAIAELVDRARDDLSVPASSGAAAARRPWGSAALAALAVPALAFGLYLVIGTPEAADARRVGHEGAPMTPLQIEGMVDDLARKVRARPDDVQGWSLLARSMEALGRFPEAVEAYRHLMKLRPDDPRLLADYADALGMEQGRSLAGRPTELLQQALALDPKQPKALALAGTAAFDAGDFGKAAGYWRSLAEELPAGSPDRAQVESMLGEARARAAAAGARLPAPAAPESAAQQSGKSVAGSVSVAPKLAARIDPSATLFVFARAENGPTMPLAVVRAPARELPLSFRLDDSQAMSPQFKLSSAAAVRIEARISRSGDAAPRPGDLVGSSGIVKPGARDVRIVVDKVLQ